MANYTYTIGTDTAPVEINVKPDDSVSPVSLNVEGELGTGQVFVDKTSAADVSIKAKLEAEDFATYTYKKADVVAYRETIKETNRVEVTANDTPEADGEHQGKYKVTTVIWELNAQGVLTKGAPADDYLDNPGTSSTTSTFKKFTATYDGENWVDNDGEVATETAPSVSYYTITSVANYNFTTNAYDAATPNDPVDAADAAAAIAAQGTTYTRFATVGETTDSGTDITSDVTGATAQNPYAYAVNNNKYDTLTLFVIKNPTNIGKYSSDYYGQHEEHEWINHTTVQLNVNGSELVESVLTDTVFDVTPSGTDFKGYANNDKAVSTDANETFKLGEGKNTIVLNTKQTKIINEVETVVGIGNDVVTLTRGENLNLQFDNGAKIEAVVKGKDVVFSTVQYVAEATVYGGTGWCTDEGGFGTADNGKKYTFELAPYHDTQFHDDNYDGKILWKATDSYNYKEGDTTYKRYVSLEAADFLTYDSTKGTCKSVDGNNANPQIVDMKVYKIVNGEKIDITEEYHNDVTAADSDARDNVTESLFDGQRVAGTVTVKDIWNKDVTGQSDFYSSVGLTVNNTTDWKEMISSYDGEHFKVEAKNKAITGTYKDELAVSGKDGEKINLGTGRDQLVFRGDFGSDTVTVNNGEELLLNFGTDTKDIVFTTKGKDIVATANVKYYVTAKATVDFSYDGIDYKKDTVYTFEAKKLSQSGKDELVDTYQWLGTTTREPHEGEVAPVGMVLENADIIAGAITEANAGGTAVRLSDISVYKSVNGGEGVKVTSFTETDYRNAEVAYNALINGTVTIKDIYGKDIEGYVGVIGTGSDDDYGNIFSYLKDYNEDFEALEVKPNKKTFTGTFKNEVAISTKDNETFNMGTGSDKLVFSGDFGNDTVKLTKGSNTNLFFLPQNSSDPSENMSDLVKFTTKGNDVVASIDVKYYVTAKATGDFSYDGIDYKKDTVYTFEAKKLSQSGKDELVDTYQWLGTTTREPHEGEVAPVGMVLENADIIAGAITEANAGGTAVRLSDISVYKSVNGGEGVKVTSFTETDYRNAEVAYNSQISGSVTLKDFNAKDIQAKVSIGYGADIRELPAFVAANTYDTQEVFAGGKITTKAQDDIINASNYNSPNGKGVTINSGSGNDIITGSNYNDKVTVKSLAGQYASVTESSGTNKITMGKGNDTVNINPGLSNNTIKLGNGDNSVTISGFGKNTVTGGKDKDIVTVDTGINSVNAKNGENIFTVNGGNNKLTGGKNVDTFTLEDGQNTVKAGKGDDVVELNGGYNTVDLGAGNDKVVANDGYNVIKGSKGNNVYELEGGSNVITGGSGVDEFIFNADDTFAAPLNAIINGGKGNDIYDLTKADYTDSINITDTKGKNVVKLADKDTILFDVTLGKNAKKDKAGKVLTFRNDDGDVTFKGKISTVNVDGTDYTLNVKGVAEQVASFMRSAGYGKGDSAYDVLAAGGDNAAKLLAIYEGTGVGNDPATNSYKADIYYKA